MTSNWTHATRSSDRLYAGAGEFREGGGKGVLILPLWNLKYVFGGGGVHAERRTVMYDRNDHSSGDVFRYTVGVGG